MDKRLMNNQVEITGEIITNFTHNHDVWGEGFYKAVIRTRRNSGESDQLPIMVSERLMDVTADWRGSRIRAKGQLRSYNNWIGGKSRLELSVFVLEVEAVGGQEANLAKDPNLIKLDGFLCKKPVYRETPLGREITDLLLAVNRPFGKTDYIPCICWGRNAKYAAGFKVGDRCVLEGRIQSRTYTKVLEGGILEERIAYEVSASQVWIWLPGEED